MVYNCSQAKKERRWVLSWSLNAQGLSVFNRGYPCLSVAISGYQWLSMVRGEEMERFYDFP
jgi:hypothetical protein